MIVIVILVVTFLAGTLFGVLAVLRLGTGRDDRDGSLRGEAPTLAASGSRRLTGLWVRTPQCTAGAPAVQRWQSGRRHGRR
jgi:hypothetical protein